MGWFDQEQGRKKSAAAPQPSIPKTRPTKEESVEQPSQSGGSSLGRHVHVDGTIVSEEDLTILGKVTGDIRAKRTLMIAKEADVHARIDGQRVLVHGEVEGDIYGAEKVVLGATASLEGNIEAPALEISEGAFFRGQVDMKKREEPSAKEPDKRGKAVAEKAAPEKAAPAKAASEGDKKPAKSAATADKAAAASQGSPSGKATAASTDA